jgi:EmrB/QacA subfamily drug resistance transporter
MSDGLAQFRPAATVPSSVRANVWPALWAVNIGAFMTALDTSIVNISLPTIARTFGTPIGGAVEWVIIAYLLVIAATLVSFGRWSDFVGRKPIYSGGLAVFVLGSACCGAAPSLPVLVAARVFQGLGGAMMLATAQAIIADTFPPDRRGLALGMNSVVIALGFSAGPTLGGLITQYLDWRWIFYVNVPVGAVALVASHVYLGDAARTGARPRFDFAGAGLFAFAFLTFMLALSFGQSWGWTSVRLLGCVAIAVASIWAALRAEGRAAHPVVELGLLRTRVFGEALLSAFLAILALFAVSFMLPFYFEELRGFPVGRAGLLMSALPLTIALVAPASGTLADRLGSRWLAAGGLLLACVGLGLLATLGPDSTPPAILFPLIVTGIGQGMFQAPNIRTLLTAAPSDDEGEASGLIATTRVLGQSFSVALAGSVFASLGGATAGRALAVTAIAQHAELAPATRHLQATFLAAFRTTILVCTVIAAIGVVVTLLRRNDRKASRPVEHWPGETTTRSPSCDASQTLS